MKQSDARWNAVRDAVFNDDSRLPRAICDRIASAVLVAVDKTEPFPTRAEIDALIAAEPDLDLEWVESELPGFLRAAHYDAAARQVEAVVRRLTALEKRFLRPPLSSQQVREDRP